MRRAIGLISACPFAFLLAFPAFSGTTNYTYDTFGRLTGVTYADGGSVTYQYDKAGNRTAVTRSASTNSAPVAVDDATSTAYLVAKLIDPRTNDTDADGDTLTVTADTNGAHGSVSHTTTSVTYAPAVGWSGVDTFTYTVTDPKGGTDTANVTVTTANAPPVAVADSFSAVAGVAKTFDPRVNDTDPNGDSLSVSTHTSAAHGSVSHTTTAVTYTPTAGYSGPDSFTYTISDGHGGTSTATVTANVTFVNTPPDAVNDPSITTNYLTAKTFDPRINDTDADGDPLTITAHGTATHGTVSHSATSLTYTPATAWSGADNFTYTISDGNGGSDSATVTVTTANAPPVAVNDSTTTTYLTSKTLDPRTNDSDANGDALTISAHGTAAHGTVSHTSTSVTYTPATGWSGADSFTYTISDGKGGTDIGTVNITTANAPPVAATDSVSTYTNAAKTFDPRTNDSDPNGTAMTITAHGSASHGTVSHTATAVTYTPTAGYAGTDTFTYAVSDGIATTVGTVDVTVLTHNPTCENWYIYMSGVPTNVASVSGSATALSFTGHCTDVDGDTLTVTSPAMPLNFTLVPHQSLSYTYTVSDGKGGTASANFSVSRP